jgi:hypothetical protein
LDSTSAPVSFCSLPPHGLLWFRTSRWREPSLSDTNADEKHRPETGPEISALVCHPFVQIDVFTLEPLNSSPRVCLQFPGGGPATDAATWTAMKKTTAVTADVARAK